MTRLNAMDISAEYFPMLAAIQIYWLRVGMCLPSCITHYVACVVVASLSLCPSLPPLLPFPRYLCSVASPNPIVPALPFVEEMVAYAALVAHLHLCELRGLIVTRALDCSETTATSS